MQTSNPLLARYADAVSPAGPPPTIATFFLFSSSSFGIFHPSFIAISPINASNSPIAIGLSFIPLMHEPWHCLKCGQILPHNG